MTLAADDGELLVECANEKEEATCGPPRMCEPKCNADVPAICAKLKRCEKGCYCKSGYVRNKENACISKDDC
ncbi:unnamed protein product [Diamesa serratosioi]